MLQRTQVEWQLAKARERLASAKTGLLAALTKYDEICLGTSASIAPGIVRSAGKYEAAIKRMDAEEKGTPL